MCMGMGVVSRPQFSESTVVTAIQNGSLSAPYIGCSIPSFRILKLFACSLFNAMGASAFKP